MKKRFEHWRKLGLSVAQSVSNGIPELICMRSIKSVQQLEDKVLIYASDSGDVDPSIEKDFDALSFATFGITYKDTLFEFPEHHYTLSEDSREFWENEQRYNAHEKRYRTAAVSIDESVEILLKLGLDFRDLNGHPLRCTGRLRRQAEALGIIGRLPDSNVISIQIWEAALEQSAKQFMKLKKSP